MIKSVLYLRSSKDRSDVSIDAQRRALQEMAAARGFAIVGEYADAVESGKDEDRPGFQNLLRDLRAKERGWDHVLALDTARIGRRRALAIMFEEHECKKAGVRVVYKSLPESDPITEMLLKSILQAMDEWHSLTSRVKGMAGMAENVKQGWRAGGRAPRGYKLESTETGAVREGVAVTKTKLTPGDDAQQVATYLKQRAAGVKRPRALQLAGVSWPAASLVDMERNALVYAGHTTWGRTAERQNGAGYVGGEKYLPRDKWTIQRDTHPPLISDDEAETILAAIAVKKRSGGPKARRVFLLSGLLVSTAGEKWHGDSDSYRLAKGRRISAEVLERTIVERIMADMQSDTMAERIAAHYRKIAGDRQSASDPAAIRRRISEAERKATRLTDLLADTSAPAALLRQIEALETNRDSLLEELKDAEQERAESTTLRNITRKDVQRMLGQLAEDMNEADPEALRDTLNQLVESIELDASTFDAVVAYRIVPVKTGEQVASPRQAEPFPAFSGDRFSVPHNRRTAAG